MGFSDWTAAAPPGGVELRCAGAQDRCGLRVKRGVERAAAAPESRVLSGIVISHP